jgi:hypothetical protein
MGLSHLLSVVIFRLSQNIAVDTRVHVSAYPDESDQERVRKVEHTGPVDPA